MHECWRIFFYSLLPFVRHVGLPHQPLLSHLLKASLAEVRVSALEALETFIKVPLWLCGTCVAQDVAVLDLRDQVGLPVRVAPPLGLAPLVEHLVGVQEEGGPDAGLPQGAQGLSGADRGAVVKCQVYSRVCVCVCNLFLLFVAP